MSTLYRRHRRTTCGICGAFTYIDDWVLGDRVPGVIIQKITRELSIEVWHDGLLLQYSLIQARNRFDPSDTTLFLNTMVYWELFGVATVGPMPGDQFQSNWFAPTGRDRQPQAISTGRYNITGEAYFYETDHSPAYLGFNGVLPIANGLPSTTSDPSQHLAGIPRSNPVIRRVTATWDSRVVTNPPNARGVTQIRVS